MTVDPVEESLPLSDPLPDSPRNSKKDALRASARGVFLCMVLITRE
jgi:hypothetical protein